MSLVTNHAGAYLHFPRIKRLRVFLLYPERNEAHQKNIFKVQFIGTNFFIHICVERETVRVKGFTPKKYNTIAFRSGGLAGRRAIYNRTREARDEKNSRALRACSRITCTRLFIANPPVLHSIASIIKSILKSLAILAVWLAISGGIYSRIALLSPVNRIFLLSQ